MVFYNRLFLKIESAEYRFTGKCTAVRTTPKKYCSILVYRYFCTSLVILLCIRVLLYKVKTSPLCSYASAVCSNCLTSLYTNFTDRAKPLLIEAREIDGLFGAFVSELLVSLIQNLVCHLSWIK